MARPCKTGLTITFLCGETFQIETFNNFTLKFLYGETFQIEAFNNFTLKFLFGETSDQGFQQLYLEVSVWLSTTLP